MKIEKLLDGLIQREGGYVNNPADRGGPTCWGITEAVARANGYTGPMKDMPQSVARDIYRRRYWIRPGFSNVAQHSEAIADELLDTGVNMGTDIAGQFLQRCLNVLNLEAKLFPDLKPDGEVGSVTLLALAKYLAARKTDGERVLLTALNCLQGARYIAIAEQRASQETFVFGWLRERVVMPA